MNFLKIFSRIKMVSFYGKIYKLILYDLIIPSAKGYLYDSTVASYNIFSSAVAFCGNNRCLNKSTAEQECGVSISCSERI